METAILVLVIVTLVVAAVGTMVITGSAAERHRSRNLAAWAGREGWRYDRERPELVDRFSGDPFLERRSNARATHVLCADRRGHRVLAYEYGYATSRHDGRAEITTTHVHTVVAVSTPATTPVLELRQEQTGHLLLDPVGVHDLQTGDSAFDSRFYVSTTDDRFARAVLDEGVRGWLVANGSGSVPFRFAGDHLLYWDNRGLDAERVRERADTMIDLLERVPATVWESTPDALG